MLPGGADVEQLVVIVRAQILDPAKHGGAVLCEVAADIECRAGESGRNHGIILLIVNAFLKKKIVIIIITSIKRRGIYG